MFRALTASSDLLTEIEKDLGPGRKTGRWYMFHCPYHEDLRPSLGVTPENGRYYCFSCGVSGDLVGWLHDYRKLSWQDAYRYIGGYSMDASKVVTKLGKKQHNLHNLGITSTTDLTAWRKRGMVFVDECEKALWQPAGDKALAWLQKRGLTLDTIRQFRLGYHPADSYESREVFGLPDNGKKVWLPKGIVIPWMIDGVLSAINIRRPAGEPKYYKVAGSQGVLYNADWLRGAEVVLLPEGEMDCMIAHQELKDVIGVASLGSATQKLDVAKHGQYLMAAQLILVTYDLDDAGKHGVEALVGMSERIRNVQIPRLNPGDKDINDYYLAGGDLWQWLMHNLDDYVAGTVVTTKKSNQGK